jgi:hypothetical protein
MLLYYCVLLLAVLNLFRHLVIMLGKVCLVNEVPRHYDVCWSGSIVPPFLTSALDVGQWAASPTHREKSPDATSREAAGSIPDEVI